MDKPKYDYVLLDMNVPEHVTNFDQLFVNESNAANDTAENLYNNSFQQFERTPPEETKKAISGPRPTSFIVVALTPSGDNSYQIPIGFAQADLLAGASDSRQTVLLAYLANTLGNRNRAQFENVEIDRLVGGALTAAFSAAYERKQVAEVILGEVNNPAYFYAPGHPAEGKSEDRIDPLRRLRMYRQAPFRAQVIQNFHYFMPDLTGKKLEPDGRLLLVICRGEFDPLTQHLEVKTTNLTSTVHVQDVSAALVDYYAACDQPNHPRLAEMLQQLDQIKREIEESIK